MAPIVITVSEDQVKLVAEAFAQQQGFSVAVAAETAGKAGEDFTEEELLQLKVDFARDMIGTYVQMTVRNHLAWQHAQQAPELPDAPVTLT